ncbi:DNA mismatch repair protein [Coemansia asiatica]|uniref:DNA mismatch repair protein n=1 Tax=Coemansia asiatica TaxID=1052880 RepID=A0A9W8CGW4_9FUNG|nr:DNA mismatch repair protein [Coemansia asiatica]
MSMSVSSTAARKPAPIQRLDETVINRIAAGEIINRPSNALKELIENSLDAGATSITVTVKDGGIKLLQIQDNGHGIRTEDLPLVCERFTTSKLKIYEDLSTIQTYGFRGEALASISHVSHLSITTKQADSECAYKAHYSDGKLAPAKPGGNSDPEPCAGNNGTIIAAEDLFYNIPSRKNALKNTRDEYNRIYEVASRYAIHNASVAFTCRKLGATKPDLCTQQNSSAINNIGQVFGAKIAASLVEISYECKDLDASFSGYVSSASHEMHKSVFLLFINHRLVDHTPIKRAVESLYSSVLPKASRPFVYLDLRIKPENVDVNVHPTKREVRFLNEDSIVGAIVDCIHKKLTSTNNSRSFAIQQSSIGKDTSRVDLVQATSSLSSSSISEAPLMKTLDATISDLEAELPATVSTPTRSLTTASASASASASALLEEATENPTSVRRMPPATPNLDHSRSSIMSPMSSSNPQKTPVSRTVRTNYKNLSLDSFMFGASPSIRRGRVQSTIETDFSITPTKTTPSRTPLSVSPSHANRISPDKSDISSLMLGSPNSGSGSASLMVPSTAPPVILMNESLENAEKPIARRGATQPSPNNSPQERQSALQSQMSAEFPVLDPPPGSTGKSFMAADKEPRVEVRLTSILGLRKELQRRAHHELTQILSEHTFVGFVDDRRALIQHRTRLYMADFCKISYHLFYHRIIFDFMNYGRLLLQPPPSIRDLALLAARELDDAANADAVADRIAQRFSDSHEMLEEYFHIRVNDACCIESMPMLVRDYSPDYDKLPLFLHSAAFSVNWDDEVQFFKTFSSVLATFYAVEPPLAEDPQTVKDDFRMLVEHRVLPALKGSSFWAPDILLTENALVQLVDVPDLYRIFERC